MVNVQALSEEADKKIKLESSKPEAFNIGNAEAIRRLRAKDQPVRLFGESDKERRLRLRALELIEQRTQGQQNEFMRALEGMDKGLDLEELQRRTTGNALIEKLKQGEREASSGPNVTSGGNNLRIEDLKEGGQVADIVDLTLMKSNPGKLYPQIYYGIKRVLKEWEESMAERPGK